MKNLLAVYLGNSSGEIQANSVHRKWLKSVDADELILSTPSNIGSFKHTIVRNILLNRHLPSCAEYDVIVFESPAVVYCAPLIKKHHPDIDLVFLDASWHTVGPSAYDLESLPSYKRPIYFADRWLDARILHWIYNNTLDGALTVSKMMADHIRDFSGLPVEIVRPTIKDDTANNLRKVSPSLDSQNIIFVGASRGHKGLKDFLNHWPTVYEELLDPTLELVGNHPEAFDEIQGVNIRGYVDNLSRIYESASLQIHPARFDTSPVSTLSGMLAGVPQIVTTKTGTRTEVAQIAESLVVESGEEAMVDRIIEYFELPMEDRRVYSKKAQKVAENFTEPARQGEFREKLGRLLESMDE
jgi:glycosyltransferase involved in cell wall biosynthesis